MGLGTQPWRKGHQLATGDPVRRGYNDVGPASVGGKNPTGDLANVWVRVSSHTPTPKGAGSIPGQGTHGRQPIDVSL